jgi:23S rRNA pseudouridine1911/1915/1917 synthase
MIVHEDDDILVVNKPPGMLTASGPKDERPTLWRTVQARARAQKWRKPMGIIHRLDRDACGLLVFSKNNDAYQSLKTQFFRHTVERIYMAIVSGTPRPVEGTIDNYLDEWKDGTVHKTRQHGRGERAVSDYETCSITRKLTLVRVKLQTGRKHQIRVHLAGINHPIVGDGVYNPQAKEGDRLMLVAMRLCFDHPRTGRRMEFELPLPAHMRKCLREAGGEDGKHG